MSDDRRVIVVGSGPSGASAAWPLVEAGVPVLMLDAGTPDRSGRGLGRRPPLHVLRTAPEVDWHLLLGEDLEALRMVWPMSPKLRTAARRGMVEDYRDGIGLVLRDFVAVGGFTLGGLSNIWGGVVSCFDDVDLGPAPIGAADLRPSYRAVAERIGISGSKDDAMAPFHGTDVPLQPPLPLAEGAAAALARAQEGRATRVGRSRNAVLSKNLGTRAACALDGTCMWGCPHESIYDAAFDVRALSARRGFSYRGGFLVEAVEPRSDGGWLIKGRDRRDGTETVFEARYVVLAAGVLATTRLVLRMKGLYGQSRPLLSSPTLGMALCQFSRLGKPLPRETYGMAQLSFSTPCGDQPWQATGGVLFGADGISAPDIIARMPLSRRSGMRLIRALLSTLHLGLLYFPGEYSANRIRLERDGGGARLVVEGGRSPAFARARRAALRTLTRDFRRLGLWLLPGSVDTLPSGSEVHYGGTLPMGRTTTAECELEGHPGLFIADGSVLCRLPGKHQTFTVMANADRVGRIVARRLA